MPPLSELQQDFARAVWDGDVPAMALMGCVPPAEALTVHRDTVLGALVNALRISYPSVDALVGEEFFDRTGYVFAERNPPATASLTNYGASFAEFLAGFAPAASLAYLPDVARLDRAVEQALRMAERPRRFALGPIAAIELPESLAILQLTYPADEIRAALGDDAALAAIALDRAERFVLVWRKAGQAAVQPVDAVCACFLAALLRGGDAEAAFQAATQTAGDADVLNAIQAGIFAATFCNVISTDKELPP